MQAPSYLIPVATAYGTGQGVEVLNCLRGLGPHGGTDHVWPRHGPLAPYSPH